MCRLSSSTFRSQDSASMWSEAARLDRECLPRGVVNPGEILLGSAGQIYQAAEFLHLRQRRCDDGQAGCQILANLQRIRSQGEFVHDERRDGDIERLAVARKRLIGFPAEQMDIRETTQRGGVGADLSISRKSKRGDAAASPERYRGQPDLRSGRRSRSPARALWGSRPG